MKPEFEVGQFVRKGPQGRARYKVVAVINNPGQRIPTYDLVSDKKSYSVGVPETRLIRFA